MNHFIKSILVTSLFTLAVYSSVGQKVIELRVDPQNHTSLILSDKGETHLGKVWGRKVFWVIKDSEIESFQIVPKFADDNGPLEDIPSKISTNRFDTKVSSGGQTGNWYYSIKWTNHNTHQQFTYDPKIAVKPVWPWAWNFILLIITILTSIIYYSKWRDVSRKLEKYKQGIR